MKSIFYILLIFASEIFISCGSKETQAEHVIVNDNSFDAALIKYPVLKKLLGRWEDRTDSTLLAEEWQIVKGEMIGFGLYVYKNDTNRFETLRIAMVNDTLCYFPTVYGENDGKEIPFKIAAIDSVSFFAANSEHDFPKEIIYEIIANDSLHATLNGIDDNKPSQSEFSFKKIKSKN